MTCPPGYEPTENSGCQGKGAGGKEGERGEGDGERGGRRRRERQRGGETEREIARGGEK